MEKAIKELRLTELRALEDERMIVEGYAVVFDSVTDLGWRKEVVDRNAFNGCDMSDVCMKYNHSDELLIMARTRNNSLQLIIDERGLKIRAELIDTTQNRDIYKMIQSELLTKMSFAFTVAEEEIDYETDTRTILRIDKLFDVSVVDVPAYEATDIYARSKEEYEKEKEQYESKKLELEKEKLKLQLSL
ncbi:MAG: HK97 family phage prohead protease [Acutalibacteraceae bacterium]|nr:HK97 family phage prohead protease [Acutalibacteraceae bacterium]